MNGPGTRGRYQSHYPHASDFRFGGSVKDSDGAGDQRAALDRQLRRLRSWEDPANASATAVVYRELLAAADARATRA